VVPGNRIGNGGAFALANLLKRSSTIEELYLDGLLFISVHFGDLKSLNNRKENFIQDGGIYKIAKALKTNSTLTTLDLSG